MPVDPVYAALLEVTDPHSRATWQTAIGAVILADSSPLIPTRAREHTAIWCPVGGQMSGWDNPSMRRGIRTVFAILCLSLAPLSSASASGRSGKPYVHFKPAKKKISKLTRKECLPNYQCKHRIRHCRRWAANQVACQSEIMVWNRKGLDPNEEPVYCHWISLAARFHGSVNHLSVLVSRPECVKLHHGPSWPIRVSKS